MAIFSTLPAPPDSIGHCALAESIRLALAPFGGSAMAYRVEYAIWAYGTERALSVVDADSDEVLAGPVDPFWPVGIPAEAKARRQIIAARAVEMVRELRAS